MRHGEQSRRARATTPEAPTRTVAPSDWLPSLALSLTDAAARSPLRQVRCRRCATGGALAMSVAGAPRAPRRARRSPTRSLPPPSPVRRYRLPRARGSTPLPVRESRSHGRCARRRRTAQTAHSLRPAADSTTIASDPVTQTHCRRLRWGGTHRTGISHPLLHVGIACLSARALGRATRGSAGADVHTEKHQPI